MKDQDNAKFKNQGKGQKPAEAPKQASASADKKNAPVKKNK